MARVTRFHKIKIAEDHPATQPQSFDAPSRAPTKQLEPLSEISGHNLMPPTTRSMPLGDVDQEVSRDIKGLKAAYKSAIGLAKRGRKSKKSKESRPPSVDVQEVTIDTQEGAVKRAFGGAASNNAGDGPSPPAPAGRTTRQQLAKAQAAEEEFAKSRREMTSDHLARSVHADSVDYRAEVAVQQETAPTDVETVNHHDGLLASQETAYTVSIGMVPNTHHEAAYTHTDLRNGCGEPIIQPDTGTHTTSTCQEAARTLDEVEKIYGPGEHAAVAADGSDDSFVRIISARSPAKLVVREDYFEVSSPADSNSRIEDSLEALDQLEEALDALDQAALAETVVSPIKGRHTTPSGLSPKAATGKQPATRQNNSSRGQAPKSGYATLRVKSTASKPSPLLKKATSMTFRPATTSSAKGSQDSAKAGSPSKTPVKRLNSLLPPKDPVKSTKQLTRPDFELPGEAVARKLKEQREARLARMESSEDTVNPVRSFSGPKIKSTKVLTRPDFELPGEAVSRKKKEAQEARLKAQEEELRQRRAFKATPIRNTNTPSLVVRETVASRARQSRIGLEDSPSDSVELSKKNSNVGLHRPSIADLNKANVSAPRSKASPAPTVRKPSATTHGPSMSGRAMQRTVSATDAQIQRQRAKEIYKRDEILAAEMAKEKREREEAARRAREEAAERGRQASREWAAKNLAKKPLDRNLYV